MRRALVGPPSPPLPFLVPPQARLLHLGVRGSSHVAHEGALGSSGAAFATCGAPHRTSSCEARCAEPPTALRALLAGEAPAGAALAEAPVEAPQDPVTMREAVLARFEAVAGAENRRRLDGYLQKVPPSPPSSRWGEATVSGLTGRSLLQWRAAGGCADGGKAGGGQRARRCPAALLP